MGLAVPYADSPEVKKFVRRLAVLPLVPVAQIDNVWMELHGTAPGEVPGIDQLCDYMVSTWLDDVRPVFPRDVWNHFENFENDGIRTNNHLESFHSAFRRRFGSPHPHIFSFVTAVKQRQAETELTVRLLQVGNAPPPRKRVARLKEERLTRTLEQFRNGDRDIWSYMDAISFSVKLH